MKDFLTTLKLKQKELKSSLVILQQAIQSDNSSIQFADIDNHLEIIIKNFGDVIEQTEQFCSKNLGK